MKIVDLTPSFDILGNGGRKPEPKVSLCLHPRSST